MGSYASIFMIRRCIVATSKPVGFKALGTAALISIIEGSILGNSKRVRSLPTTQFPRSTDSTVCTANPRDKFRRINLYQNIPEGTEDFGLCCVIWLQFTREIFSAAVSCCIPLDSGQDRSFHTAYGPICCLDSKSLQIIGLEAS